MTADIDVTVTPTWNAGAETFTLINKSTSSGSSADMQNYVYGLINPTVKADNIAYTVDSTTFLHHAAVNYINTNTDSVADATNFLSEDVNDTVSSTNVHSSAGGSGETLFFGGCVRGGDGDPSSNATGFTELGDSATGTNNNNDLAFYIADSLNNAAKAITVTFNTSDENVGQLVEILKASAAPAFIAQQQRPVLRAVKRASSY